MVAMVVSSSRLGPVGTGELRGTSRRRRVPLFIVEVAGWKSIRNQYALWEGQRLFSKADLP